MSTRLIVPMPKGAPRARAAPLHFDQQKSARRARRVLFGRPNPDETLQFWTRELRAQRDLASEKYSFDFEEGVPIVGPAAKYVYTSCEIVRAPIKKRPDDDFDDFEDSQLEEYFKPDDVILNCLRDDSNSDESNKEGPREPLKEKKQTCITDFMLQRKRNVSMVGEKSDHVIVPTKVAKFDAKS